LENIIEQKEIIDKCIANRVKGLMDNLDLVTLDLETIKQLAQNVNNSVLGAFDNSMGEYIRFKVKHTFNEYLILVAPHKMLHEHGYKLIQINTLPGFEHVADYYYVDTNSEIWTIEYEEPQTMHPIPDNNGYTGVELKMPGQERGTRYYISRIVATAFIPNHNGWRFVKHRNKIPGDNSIDNLMWSATPSGSGKPVIVTHVTTGNILPFPSVSECAEYMGVAQPTISKALASGGKFCDKIFTVMLMSEYDLQQEE
jgi:hypothetical protein